MDFYSSSGAPIAYSDDEGHIYLFSGKPVAYLSGTAVYTFAGRHIGWFDNGWIRDLGGYAVFFTSAARGGPLKPVTQIKPVKGVKNVQPIKGVRQVTSVKPVWALSWSRLSGERYFA